MDTNELLNRIKERDTDAYLQLTQTYGWKLYSHLRNQFDDRQMADRAFNETLTSFCNALAGENCADAVEALLFAFADQTCQKLQKGIEAASVSVKDPVEPMVSSPQEQKKSGSFGFGLGVGVLVLGILAALWVIVGLLMDMNMLPELDLGYSWFNTNIAPWF